MPNVRITKLQAGTPATPFPVNCASDTTPYVVSMLDTDDEKTQYVWYTCVATSQTDPCLGGGLLDQLHGNGYNVEGNPCNYAP